MTKIRENALDAQYVGRAVQIVQEQMADAVQVCVTPAGVDLDLFKFNSRRRAEMIVAAVFSETFREYEL
jgi:hypothetical protein